MRLVVFSDKQYWSTADSPSGYATDGGFPFQMQALSELFDSTRLVLPNAGCEKRPGGNSISGHNISVVPLGLPFGRGLWRKALLPLWLLFNSHILFREILKADAVHTPIPSDIATLGMLMAFVMRKPLFVRYCGNWFMQKTIAEHSWKLFIEWATGGRNVSLATGGASQSPSKRNAEIRWIFSSSLKEQDLTSCYRRRELPACDSLRLIIVARQEGGKGTEVVLKSLPLLLGQYPGVRLDVVGDGSAMTELKRLSSTLALNERVFFHGKVDHKKVIELLKQADLFCYPTASEGFPKSVLEALACGLPVVTTRVSVLPQLIENGCGMLIDETTPAALARAVRECLADAGLYRAMSNSALETARLYSLERWRDTIGDVLKKAWGPLQTNA